MGSITSRCLRKWARTHPQLWGGGGELPYKSDGDGLRKTEIKPLRETNVGVAQSLTYP